MSIPEYISYKHQCRASSKSECKDFFRRIGTGSQSSEIHLYEIMQQHLENFTRTSSKSSHKDLYKIMLRLWHHFTRTCERSSPKDPYQIMLGRLLEDFHQDLYRSLHKELYKTFMPGPDPYQKTKPSAAGEDLTRS
jgi:hypothetical protein